jgi:hypothetical protein
MAITNTWSVTNMTHVDADGGVVKAYWSCTAGNVTGQDPSGADQYDYTASEGGKLICTYDASAAGFIAYASLTEANVLGWIYDSLKEGSETAAQAKKRIEDNRKARVQGQIDRAATQDTGVPW